MMYIMHTLYFTYNTILRKVIVYRNCLTCVILFSYNGKINLDCNVIRITFVISKSKRS